MPLSIFGDECGEGRKQCWVSLGTEAMEALRAEVRGKLKAEGESCCLPLRESHREAKFEGNRSGGVETCHGAGIQSYSHNDNGLRTS